MPPILPSTPFKLTNRTSKSIHLHGLSTSIISIEPSTSSSILNSSPSNPLILSRSNVRVEEMEKEVKGEVGGNLGGEEIKIIINRISKFQRTKLIKSTTNSNSNSNLWIFQTSSIKQQPSSYQHLIAYTSHNTSTWMSELPDSRLLSSLYLPGTHESLALHGYPISTCQSSSSLVLTQLNSGLRFLDLRFSLFLNLSTKVIELRGYHGIQNQYILASSVLESIYDFLIENNKEVVIVSIKQENNSPGFEKAFWNLIDENRDRWYLDNKWPSLGEARGRIVLFSRFSNRLGYGGLQPMRWPNNSSSVWETQIGDIDLLVQDWYSIGSFTQIPEKVSLALSLFRPSTSTSFSTSTSTSSPQTTTTTTTTNPIKVLPLRLNYLSGATFLTAFPFIVAKGFFFGLGIKGVNERVLRHLLLEYSTVPPIPLVEQEQEDKGGGVRVGEEVEAEAGERKGVEGKRDIDGGMILLQDYFEVPGGLTELMIAWNFQ